MAEPPPRHEIVSAVEDTHWWFVAQREMVAAVLAAEVAPGADVLDAGCGTGAVVDALADRYRCAGVDVDAPSLEVCRRRRPGLRFEQASADALPFADASFDAVLSLDVLGNVGVRDKPGLVREARRVLRPGGTLVLQVAAYDWLRSAHDAAVGSERRFTVPEVRALLVAAGLTPRLMTYRVSTLFGVAAATRLLRRGGARNQVGPVPTPLNRALTRLTIAENRLARRRPLPFGLSVFAVGRAPNQAQAPGRTRDSR